jgi:hypothetical protein
MKTSDRQSVIRDFLEPFGPVMPRARPPCLKCGEKTMLARLEPESPGFERRTFECPSCKNTQQTVAAFE